VGADNCNVIRDLERHWRDALCSKDMSRLESLVHPDFVLIGTRSTGPFMMNRREWLDAIQRREVEAIDVEVQDATVINDTMIGTVHARWRLKYLGRMIEDCVVLTDVWVKDDGRWQAIRRHSTPAPPGACINMTGE
jgi:ketosteroid isomerase-like protein